MDPISIFKSKTRRAIFRLYFTNPDRKYYLRELERELNIPVSMISKELVNLEQLGIFTSSRMGNLRLFALNQKYPLFDELKSIVFKTVGVVGMLSKAITKLKGVEVAFVYGSFAKEDAGAASDIDLFIIGRVHEGNLVRQIAKAEHMLKREINYSLYSKADYMKKKRENDSFINDLLDGPKLFLVGGPSEL
ncbi:MAG: nucleotidyltransferase domain-containing protein [Candidatus Saganbacteria bacterium]|nr:nucleotidyltransferase domain-containing protein [Candidatus Saganbacteria bacterium]